MATSPPSISQAGTQASAIEWEFLLENIKSEKTIVFLGPEIFTNEQGKSLREQLYDHLDVDHNPNIKTYDDGLFYFNDSPSTPYSWRVKQFYQNEFPKARRLLQQVAKIPFHFMISITQDVVLTRVFKEEGFNCRTDDWKKVDLEAAERIPTSTNPLIFKFFGSADNDESLILTHDDLFNFLNAMFQGDILSRKLRHHIKHEARQLIFLGIQFDKWYMQLLLRFLNLHRKEDRDPAKHAFNQAVNEEIVSLCLDHFHIHFVPNKVDTFIEEIYRRCEEKGILRQSKEESPSEVDKFLDMLRKGKMKRVLEELVPFIENLGTKAYTLQMELFRLQSRHSDNELKAMQGIITSELADVNRNNILNALLHLLQELKRIE